MSFYCVVAQHNPDIFNDYLMPGLQKWEIDTAISMDADSNKTESIFAKYNDGIKKLLEKTDNPIKEDDIICFVHEDVKIIDPFFIPKIELVFKERGDIGLCGVVGATELIETGAWWQTKAENLRGHIIQEDDGKITHLLKGMVGFFDEMAVVDGLCFFMRGSLFMDGLRFDDRTYDGFDFYDIDTCITVLEKGFKIGCADILLQHRSIGDVSKRKSWYDDRDKFIAKWKAKGIKFPITQKTFINDNIKSVEV
jgi:hypothetical protein